MFRIDDPDTWPKSGDQLWMPWRSQVTRRVSKVSHGKDGKPWVLFMDGERDLLYGWQYYPRVGDRAIVSAAPLERLYSHWNLEDTRRQLIRQEFAITGTAKRPRGSFGFSPPEDYKGEFFSITPEGDHQGKPVIIAADCLTVISPRYQSLQAV